MISLIEELKWNKAKQEFIVNLMKYNKLAINKKLNFFGREYGSFTKFLTVRFILTKTGLVTKVPAVVQMGSKITSVGKIAKKCKISSPKMKGDQWGLVRTVSVCVTGEGKSLYDTEPTLLKLTSL